jgi:hypothetical protein
MEKMALNDKSSDDEGPESQTFIVSEPEIRDILWQYKNNRSITTPLYYVILCSYVVIGILAVFSNSLVVLAVVRNKKV